MQVKIINSILKDLGDDHFILYHPAGKGKKHEYYFSQLLSNKKYFLRSYDIKFLNYFIDFIYFYFLPRSIRLQKYENFFFASLTHPIVSMLEKRVENKDLNLFDDGNFNIDKQFFSYYVRLATDSKIYSSLRLLLHLKSPQELLANISNHFSIYDHKHTKWMHCKNIKVNIFRFPNLGSLKKIRIILGYTDDLVSPEYKLLQNSKKFDVFLPHPDSSLKLRINNKFLNDLEEINFSDLIAEDIIYLIIEKGYEPIVYGFQSSTLINLPTYIKTVCFFSTMSDKSQKTIAKSMNGFGIKTIMLDQHST